MTTTLTTITRPIDAAQLDDEVRIAVGLTEPPGLSVTVQGDELTLTVHADVDQTLLAAVLAAHLPAPAPPTRVDLLQAQVDELTDLMLGGL